MHERMSFKSSSSGGSIAPVKMDSANLLVKGFPSTIRESELQEVFSHYGNNTCKLVSGLAFVSFANIMDAYNATTALHGRNGLQVLPLPAMSGATFHNLNTHPFQTSSLLVLT